MAYLDNIEDMYKKMYEARNKKALTDKETAISGINTQKGKIDNDYLKLQNDLGTAKKTKEAEYQGLYTSLDNQSQEGKDMYYQDRNSASVQNVQKVQAIKDYMARNNLMSSGENVDAMLRSNTDYNNNLGNIYSNEKKFIKGIEDNRNAYKLQEQGAYNTIDNQLSTAENNYTLDLADIAEKTRLAEEGYLNSMAAYQDELDAQKLNDINNYNLQQQQLAASRSSSGGGSSGSSKASKDAEADQVWSVFEARMNDGTAEEFLNDNAEGIIRNLGRTEYYKMKDRYEKARYGDGNGRYTQKRLNTKNQEETYNKMYEV